MNAIPILEHRRIHCSAASGFGLIELTNASPLRVQLLPSGAVFAIRHGATLINQLMPGPVDDGLFRLLLRWRGERAREPRHESPPEGWARLVGAGLVFEANASGAVWRCIPLPGLQCETRLQLHATLPAWSWQIKLHNASLAPFALDVLHAQDLGLADETAVRNNEAYVSQYIDLYPVRDHELGWTLLARQNQQMAGQQHPWLGVACTGGAAEYCTDGWQFFGPDHRLTGVPAAVRRTRLPSHVFQYEAALAGLQSQLIALKPGADAEVTFIARFVDDHPAASSAEDVELIRALAKETAVLPSPAPIADRLGESDDHAIAMDPPRRPSASLFIQAPWLHGDPPTIGDWDAWFHGPRRHEEFGQDDSLLSFFHGPNTHVVAREKEAVVFRPHGHILRSGDSHWFDHEHFGVTCYAAGIFGAQAYLGHPSFARLLSVIRNALNATRSSGQRVFVRREGQWQQLGIPSAFVIKPGEVRWLYRFGDDVIGARVWCARKIAASFLALSVTAGPACEFLITHELALGALEFEHPGTLAFQSEASWVSCEPSRDSLVGQHQPNVAFAIASAEAGATFTVAGDGLVYPDGMDRHGPYVTVRTRSVEGCGVIMLGTSQGVSALAEQVAVARQAFASHIATTSGSSAFDSVRTTMDSLAAKADAPKVVPPSLSDYETLAVPPRSPIRLSGDDAGIARVNEVLPWFAHNASIHFSAPHGLEQYGGAAWGVRDVCQGSVEWLLTAGEFATVRRILETVFAQQYAHVGSWPQWFMFPPYRFIQQAHSHGDVCFWPVKALCDYVEATNDLAFLNVEVGYTDPAQFTSCGPQHSILDHCDLVIAQARARFFPGTVLVNYGDGDWDDTLQPADPAMRTRMISAWTVALAFQTFRQLAEVCRRADNLARAGVLSDMLASMRNDFAAHLMPGGVVAGFVFGEPDGRLRPLLHPQDEVTRIRYRLLPMTRSILAELFTPEEAQQHLAIVAAKLSYPDGVRLMSEPATYRGGQEHWFKRAESAANVGREIGLQYVHAHLRYAESLAKVGDAEGLWQALQVVNPVDLTALVPHAARRQSNAYFSSSDADFSNRYEAAARWSELRSGRVAVRGGWRIYSSGPGLFLHAIRASLLGVRESFEDIVFDPVLPRTLDGLVAEITLCDCAVELRYRVRHGTSAPRSLSVNGIPWNRRHREQNPYRPGGLLVPRSHLIPFLHASAPNLIELEL